VTGGKEPRILVAVVVVHGWKEAGGGVGSVVVAVCTAVGMAGGRTV